MEVEFANTDMQRLEIDPAFDCGFEDDVVRAYRKRMQFIRSAVDERDIYAFRSVRFKKLKGNRSHQHSLRLNDQWRLIVEVRKGSPRNMLYIVAIEDYH